MTSLIGPVIGIDFGTTNSVVAVLGEDSTVRTRRFPGATGPLDVFRSVLCFWTGGPGAGTLRHAAGPAAIEVPRRPARQPAHHVAQDLPGAAQLHPRTGR